MFFLNFSVDFVISLSNFWISRWTLLYFSVIFWDFCGEIFWISWWNNFALKSLWWSVWWLVSAHNNDKVEVIGHKLIYCEAAKTSKTFLNACRNKYFCPLKGISEEYFCADFHSTLACDLLIQSFATAAATETLESEKFHHPRRKEGRVGGNKFLCLIFISFFLLLTASTAYMQVLTFR